MDKNYLHENVSRVGHIHNKIRNQQHIRRDQPIKAYRQEQSQFPEPNLSKEVNHKYDHHPLESYKRMSTVGKSSGHSDYFSLTTGASPHDLNASTVGTPNHPHPYVPHRSLNPIDRNVLQEPQHFLPPEPNLKYRSKSFHKVPLSRDNDCKTVASGISNYSTNRTSQSILSNIKTQKPSCELSTNIVWNTMRLDHKALFKSASRCATPSLIEHKDLRPLDAKSSQSYSHKSIRSSNPILLDKNAKKFRSTSNLTVPNSVDLRNMSISCKESQKSRSPLENCNSSGSLSAAQSMGSSASSITLAFSCSDADQDRPQDFPRADENHLPPEDVEFPKCPADPEAAEYPTYPADSEFPKGPKAIEYPTEREPSSLKSSSLRSLNEICHGNDEESMRVMKNLKFSKNLNHSNKTMPVNKAYEAKLNRSKSSNNLKSKTNPPSTYRLGEVPRYLLARKAKIERELKEKSLIDPKCPPGHAPLAEEERKNTLDLLVKGHEEVISKMSRLPLGQDTLRVRKYRSELESKLNHIEEGIHIFSQPKVYVLNDT